MDVKTADGERLQVKALRQTSGGKRRNLSPIRDRDYDAVIVVIFNEDFAIEPALKLSRAFVESVFPRRPYVNGRVITISKALYNDPEVERVELSDLLLDA